ncbi:MAG: SDR family oxidoreductase [Actinomycetota bacterium]|nr:SDR family oxidoreductase [Actinomycetota bacterium]
MATYLITGATRGIGRAVVDILADDNLIVLARDAVALERLASQLPSARPIAVDLARPAALETALGAAGLSDRLDGIVHAAGVNINGRLSEVGTDEWTEQLVVNVVAVAELNRLLLPALRAAQGTVVFINSGAGRAVKRAGGTAYAASKHALVAVADGLRLEEPDLRVTTVFPGRVATEMQKDLRTYEGGEYRAEDYVHPVTLAQVVAGALRLPADASMNDVAVMPNS